ncbi:MAG: MFS transporter [Planctomycetota bacterium]
MIRQYLDLPRSIHILCFGSLVNRAGTFVVIFLTLYLKTSLGLSVTFATTTMGFFGAGAIVASLVGGQLADQIGRRPVMLFALLGGAVILVVFSFVTTPWLIVLMVLLFACVAETFRPAASAMIADLTTPEQRPHAFALMYVSINLGFAIGAFIGGIIASYNFHWLFWGDALTSAIFALIIFAALRETLPARVTAAAAAGARILSRTELTRDSTDKREKHRDVEPTDTAENTEATHNTEPPSLSVESVPILAAARHIVTDTPFVVFCLATFLIALVFMQSLSTLPLYIEQRGFQPHDYGKIIALNGLLIVLLQLPLTAFLARFRRGNVMVVGALLNAVGFGLTALAVNLSHFALTIVIWTLGEIMAAPYSHAIVSDLAPARLRARYMGVFTMSFSSAVMFAAPIGGAILASEDLGGRYLWSGAGVVAMISAALFFSVRRHVTQKRD